jgi:hypothetical protein
LLRYCPTGNPHRSNAGKKNPLKPSERGRPLPNPFRNKYFSKAFLAGMLLLVPALSTADTDRAKAVGSKLMCICGCQQVLTECNHIPLPEFRSHARGSE